MGIKKIIIGVGLLFLLLLQGCGTSNIFDGFVDDDSINVSEIASSADTSEEYDDIISLNSDLLDDADSDSDYDDVITLANAVINSGDASDEQLSNAYVQRAEALMGKNDLKLLVIFSKIASLADNEEESNILDELTFDTTISEVRLAAASINTADAIVSGNETLEDDLTESELLIRGMVNTIVVTEIFKQSFVFDSDFNISVSDTYSGDEDAALDALFETDDYDNNIVDYAEASYDALNKTDILESDQLTVISDLISVLEELETLSGDDASLEDIQEAIDELDTDGGSD